MKSIVIIGLGNIGKRHLQAVLGLHLDLVIYCVDVVKPNYNQLDVKNKGNIVFAESIRKLPSVIDLAIIATSASVRRRVFEELIENCEVKKIIFEKVLFQKIEDYLYVDGELKSRQIKAWVDCPRRINPSWKKIKELLNNDRDFSFIVAGGNWGLAGNTIHYLDVIKWLIGDSKLEISNLVQYSEPFDSKRLGYKEICGTVEGHGGRCRYFSISSTANTMKTQIYIISENRRIVLLDDEAEMVIEDEHDKWLEKHEKMHPTYVSETTSKVLLELDNQDDCELVSWEDSMNLHLMWIKTLSSIFSEGGLEKDICPIT